MSERKKILFSVKTKKISNLFLPFLFILTFLLIFFNKTDYYLVYKLKSAGIDVISPISKVISSPVSIAINTINNINDLRFIKKENLKLKQEIIRLKKWQILAIKNSRENVAYKKLLNSTSDDTDIIKTALVTSQSPNIYAKTAIINAGYKDKIKDTMPVINERGLVGKVISVTQNNSKVLLINDQNSSVPVKLMNKDFYAIVSGSINSKHLISSFVKDYYKPNVGDILVTSGNGNIYPKDILVGKIVAVTDENIITLPFADLNNLEFLQVLNIR